MDVKQIIAEVESKTQGSRPRTQNNPRPKTDPLVAKDRNARGQGHNVQVFSKKRLSLNLPRGLWRVLQDEEKKGHDLGPFFTNQKIVLSSTANRAFSRTCGLGGQGLGLQNVFLRTVSRTPPLKNSNDIRDKINIFFA